MGHAAIPSKDGLSLVHYTECGYWVVTELSPECDFADPNIVETLRSFLLDPNEYIQVDKVQFRNLTVHLNMCSVILP